MKTRFGDDACPRRRHPRNALTRLAAVLLCATAVACASFPPAPVRSVAPRFSDGAPAELTSIDGAALGLALHRAADERAVIIALHGMNDHSGFFADAGAWWAARRSLTTYALDQRGFGRSPERGRWPGAGALKADLRAAIEAARAAHPGRPLYVLGHSMGGAVILAAMAEGALDVDGAIVAAPGVWGGTRLPVPYRLALNVAAGVTPAKTLTGERAARQSTDNIAVLRAMGADPLVIKETRMDAILGLVRLMGEAWDGSRRSGGRVLFLYGDRDEIIPVRLLEQSAQRLCGDVDIRRYPQGWHLLLRDLQAEAVWQDIADWIEANEAADGAGPENDLRTSRSKTGPADRFCPGQYGGASGQERLKEPLPDR